MKPQDGPLDSETALRLERAVLARIRREQLARRLLWLGTFGALGVVLTLVRPLLGHAPSANRDDSGEAG